MIFEDPSRRRWRATLAVFCGSLFVGAGLVGLFLASMYLHSPLPSVSAAALLSAPAIHPESDITPFHAYTTSTTSTVALPKTLDALIRATPSSTNASLAALKGDHPQLVVGFLVQSDPESVRAFRDSSAHLDVVIPDWYRVTSSTCAIDQTILPEATTAMHHSKVAIFPRLSNSDQATWYGKEMKAILHDPKQRSCLANTAANLVGNTDSIGLNVDIEDLGPEDRDVYLEFLTELAGRLHTQNQLLLVDVSPHQQIYAAEHIARLADGVMLMSYDEHYATGEAGPVASQPWFVTQVDALLKVVPPQKLLLGVGAYGYDWTKDAKTPAQSLSYQDLMWLANRHSLQPKMESESQNMSFTYTDQNQLSHDVWFLDAHTAWNQYRIAQEKNLLGVGLWRLGLEDPRVWNIFASASGTRPDLERIPALNAVTRIGNPEDVFRVTSSASPGDASIVYNEQGSILSATYERLPQGSVLERVGQPFPEKTVVLAFDSGPDPASTERVMDVLSKYHVPALFFVVGSQAEKHPELLNKMAERGFLIGNQTYSPLDLRNASETDLQMELNRTARIIEYAYGKKTALFRPGNDALDRSQTLRLLPSATELGYVTVGSQTLSLSSQATSVEQLVQQFVASAHDPRQQVIQIAEGNPLLTEALDMAIPLLQSEGYTFASFDGATQIPVAQLLPEPQTRERVLSSVYQFFHSFQTWKWSVIYWIFMFTNLLSLSRLLILGWLVIRSAQRQQNSKPLRVSRKKVTVLIPAYNEQDTILKTIHGLQQSRHRNFEALVIDDGSTDRTAEIVRQVEQQDKRFHLITKANGGKSSALNLGFRLAPTEIVVTIDGDTILSPMAIDALIQPFRNPRVDAVCGNVEVGNVKNLLTGFQALEYTTTQNFDRRAFEELNCISVVPGATGAWRRDRVLKIGGYADDTLTEDADISLRLLESGGKIVYAAEARSRTEAPETVQALAKQRLRWSFGTYQCLKKHSSYFFKGTLGWVALPNIFLFQILYPILSPLGDLIFLWSIVTGNFAAIASGYVLFLAMDAVGSFLAFHLEQKSKKLIFLIFIQRFFYRQFMYIIAFRSLFAILRGNRQGWNKLTRVGSVQEVEVVAY